jgi:hypothetical protein
VRQTEVDITLYNSEVAQFEAANRMAELQHRLVWPSIVDRGFVPPTCRGLVESKGVNLSSNTKVLSLTLFRLLLDKVSATTAP